MRNNLASNLLFMPSRVDVGEQKSACENRSAIPSPITDNPEVMVRTIVARRTRRFSHSGLLPVLGLVGKTGSAPQPYRRGATTRNLDLNFQPRDLKLFLSQKFVNVLHRQPKIIESTFVCGISCLAQLRRVQTAARKAGNCSDDLAGPVDFLLSNKPSLHRFVSTLRSRAASSSGRRTAASCSTASLLRCCKS